MSYTAKFDGFTIYDAEGRRHLSPREVAEISFPEIKSLLLAANGFALDWDGCLWITTETDSIYRIPKEGEYLIRFDSGGQYMRW